MLQVETSTSIASIAKALAGVQSELEVVKGSTNPAFRSKYADLSAVMEGALAGLNKAGIAVMQPTVIDDEGRPAVATTLAHTSGEWIRGYYPVVAKDSSDPQKLGAGFTYARRYSLMAMIGAAPEDDDGNAAAERTAPRAAPERKAPAAASAALRGAPPVPPASAPRSPAPPRAAAPAKARTPRKAPAPQRDDDAPEAEVE